MAPPILYDPAHIRRRVTQARSLGLSWEDAEEAVATALAKLARSWPSREIENPTGYFARMVFREATKARSRARSRERLFLTESNSGSDPGAGSAGCAASAGDLAAVLDRDSLRSLHEVLRSVLAPLDAAIVALDAEGTDKAVLARLAGIAPSSVRGRLHRSRRRLREAVGGGGA